MYLAAFKLDSAHIHVILTWYLKMGWELEEHFSEGETEVQSGLNNMHKYRDCESQADPRGVCFMHPLKLLTSLSWSLLSKMKALS